MEIIQNNSKVSSFGYKAFRNRTKAFIRFQAFQVIPSNRNQHKKSHVTGEEVMKFEHLYFLRITD